MIMAVFQNQDSIVTATGLTQWDYGQVLRILGLCGLKRTEVHFALDGGGPALIQLAQMEEDGAVTVPVPDCLLETGRSIVAYVYVTDQMSGETIRTIRMPVTRRAKPQDYDSPAEKSLLRQVLDQLALKADDLSLVDGLLQLTANGQGIGTKIRLPSGTSGGREVELRNNGTAIQWRYTDSNDWTDLVSLEDLRGPAGESPEFEVRDGHLFAIYQNE